jgi:hypothetical protein
MCPLFPVNQCEEGGQRPDGHCRRQLFQVVKDHNNATVQEMLDASNAHCYEDVQSSSNDEAEDEDEHFQPKHFPTLPCVFTVVNHEGYEHGIHTAVDRVRSDGLTLHSHQSNVATSVPKENEVTSTIKKISRMMAICEHTLHRSAIYGKAEGATATYVRMMDVTSYLNKILRNAAINDALMRHFSTIERILSHPACELVEQMEFDSDLIEVSEGICFSISCRSFVPDAISAEKIGKVSPLAFVPYRSSTPPTPRFFEEGVVNSCTALHG